MTHTFLHTSNVLQIRASQWSITANLRPFTTHIYHVMIIVTGGRFRRNHFYYFLENLLNNLEFVILEFKHFYTQVCFLFICYFLLIVSQSFCELTLSTFSYFSNACKHTGWICSLLRIVLQSFCILALLIHLLYFLYHRPYRREN